jgi:hypothetical protein
MSNFYTCPVCGYDKLEDEPFSEEKGRPSFEYCPCCDFQFGYHDDAAGYSYEQWREKWVKAGMPWDPLTQTLPPEGWNPVEQLKGLKANG